MTARAVLPHPFHWAPPATRDLMLRDPAGVLRASGITPPADAPVALLHDLLRIHGLLWRPGELVARERFALDPADEGLLFGRGVWDSTRTVGGVPWLWADHLARLRHTAALLDIDLPPHPLPDASTVTAFVRTLSAHMALVVRLNVTAGPPGRPGQLWMTAQLPPAPVSAIRLQTRPHPLREDQPHLSWKTFHYAYRFRTGAEARQQGFDSALLLDANGCVLEASHANVFLRFQDGWETPSAVGGLLLPGTLRGLLLKKSPAPVREAVVHSVRLAEVREAFVTNSNMGIVPVTAIDDRVLPVGPGTVEIQNWLKTTDPAG